SALRRLLYRAPLVLGHAAEAPAGLAVRAAVLVEARERLDEPGREVAQPPRRVILQRAEVDDVADDGEERVAVGADVDVGRADVHRRGEDGDGKVHRTTYLPTEHQSRERWPSPTPTSPRKRTWSRSGRRPSRASSTAAS